MNLVILNELLNLKIDKKHLQKRHCISRRDSEPSGIPVRTLKSLRNKSRKIREFVFKCIRSSTCKSSNMHCYIKVVNIRLNPLRSTIRKGLINLKSRSRRYCSLFSCIKVMCLYKS